MPRRPVVNSINATTLDIVNTIRANSSSQYQNLIPEISTEQDLPRVGESFVGYPALANEFINALVNRIAIVRIQSATFNNPYRRLKKGYLEYGETVEDIFVDIAKVIDYSAEKAKSREFQRTIPDVKSVFHAMNWQVMYPVTIQNYDLKQAFLSFDGVRELIDKIIAQVYTAMEYDEFLLVKYLLIKSYNKNEIGKEYIDISTSDDNAAVAFRGVSNALTFMDTKYNTAKVRTTTPKERQLIFMDARYNAQFDVKVLASAFNMEKADFMGSLYLIDNFTEFDNARWAEIREANNSVEEVTAAELANMATVKAIIADERWFQIYDNLVQMSEDFVGAGLYWNYWLHNWKTIAYSPFANIVAFTTANDTAPSTITYTVKTVSADNDGNTAITLMPANGQKSVLFEQDNSQNNNVMTSSKIGVHPYGAFIFNKNNLPEATTSFKGTARLNNSIYSFTLDTEAATGATVTLSLES